MLRRVVTWKEIKELGLVPYTRQYVGRLERQGRFPQRRKHGNRVVWYLDEIVDWFNRMFQPILQLTDSSA